VDDRNVVGLPFEDLSEEDHHRIKEEMQRELDEVEVAKMKEKLACYQKTRGGVVQKGDTSKASTSKVNSSYLAHEELVHPVDVSVASKYGTDLAQLTRALAEDVHHTFNLFKNNLDGNLPRQIRSVVKEVTGNAQCKQVTDGISASASPNTSPSGRIEVSSGGICGSEPINSNFQQPYYKATAYGPTLPPGGVPYGTWLEVCPAGNARAYFAQNTDTVANGEMSEGVREQVTCTL
jgi:hypothetical protein